MAKPTITGKLGFYYDGGTGDKWIHTGEDWVPFMEEGIPGPQGPQGEQGPAGIEGAQGIQGETGLTGADGAVGPQGVKGDTGDAGADGVDGAVGPQGIQGDPGTPGVKGDTGLTGDAGADGADGAQGLPGVDGAQGVKGDTGDAGIQGPAGADSTVPGPQGEVGLTGPQGIEGVNGESFPIGTIINFAGLVADIPEGWAACDGQNGTPNLHNKFIKGSGDPAQVGDQGGSALTSSSDVPLQEHTHTAVTAMDGSHAHTWQGFYNLREGSDREGRSRGEITNDPLDTTTKTDGAHSHVVTVDVAGSGTGAHAHDAEPPYYKLMFIIKLTNSAPLVPGAKFIDGTDTPTSYVGFAGKAVSVNATEDGLEFTDGGGDTSGLVQKAGDTMTGPLTVDSAGGGYSIFVASTSAPTIAFKENGTNVGLITSQAAMPFRVRNGSNFELLSIDDEYNAKFAGTVEGLVPTLPEHLATKAYVDDKTAPAEEGPHRIPIIEVDIAGMMPSKAHCQVAMNDLGLDVDNNAMFFIIDTFGYIKPNYMIHYYKDNQEFYIAIMPKAI